MCPGWCRCASCRTCCPSQSRPRRLQMNGVLTRRSGSPRSWRGVCTPTGGAPAHAPCRMLCEIPHHSGYPQQLTQLLAHSMLPACCHAAQAPRQPLKQPVKLSLILPQLCSHACIPAHGLACTSSVAPAAFLAPTYTPRPTLSSNFDVLRGADLVLARWKRRCARRAPWSWWLSAAAWSSSCVAR